ncbi:hypothetical protein BGW80DRAFT_1383241 [Lactifluus volemus]|nr:hypothetical protein BGW80DRAFT_1383241 [Lactifluus volemus]
MRNVHDGRSHWFDTIIVTHRFSVLAMSLSSLFDVSQLTDCLRAALNMLTEYAQVKGRKRPAKGVYSLRHLTHHYTLGMSDTSDTYLTIQHMPFPLDYTQTLLSLLDILSAFYAKLAKLLGPSPFPHASQHMLGLSHPHPGVSYLFHNQTSADESLWSVALGSTPLGGTAGPGGHPAGRRR